MTEHTPLNGSPTVDLASAAAQITDEALVRMDHANWLGQFAQILGLQRPGGPPMTALRQGSIAKLQLAQRYIRLLEQRLGEAEGSIETLKKELADEREGNAEGR